MTRRPDAGDEVAGQLDYRPLEVESPVASTTGGDVFVSDRIVELLRGLGYRYVPLNPGSSFRALHDSLVNHGGNVDPKLVLCLHEEIAVSLAHGYAKASGQPAVAIVHDLVGLMHASMAVFDAWADGVPLLLLGGSGPELAPRRRYLDWVHSASTQADLVKAFTKWTSSPVDELGTLQAIAQAHRFSRSAPTAPCYVTVDAEVQERRAASPLDGSGARPMPALAAAPSEVERAAQLLLGAEFPLVTAGRSGLDAATTAPLVRLCELLAAGYQDDHGYVSFPSRHELNLTGDRSLVAEADVVLAVAVADPAATMGCFPGERGGEPARHAARLIEISASGLAPSSWCYLGTAPVRRQVELVADPLVGLGQLLEVLERLAAAGGDPHAGARAERRRAISSRHDRLLKVAAERLELERDLVPISSTRLVEAVWQAVRDLPWVLALRNTRSWPVGVWDFAGAGQCMGGSGGAGLGYGPGAMVGVALAAREQGRVAVGIVGDGELVMAANALWTATHYGLPLLVVVNNNVSFYNDELHQVRTAIRRGRPEANAWIGTRVEDPAVDFATLARGYGAFGLGPIEDPGDLDNAMAAAVDQVRRGRVAVVDVRVGRDGA